MKLKSLVKLIPYNDTDEFTLRNIRIHDDNTDKLIGYYSENVHDYDNMQVKYITTDKTNGNIVVYIR